MAQTFFILAGEASGDMHGAKLIEAFKTLEPSARFVGMGGPRMAAAGLEVAKDLTGMQVVGFWEVAKNYGFFKDIFYKLLDRLKQEKPAALICIDYPGFNLRFAKEVRKLGVPCLYYIVPQVWAWKPKRAAKMAAFIDRAYCVFDFEPPFFDRYCQGQGRMKTVFVGHPLLDREPLPSRPELIGADGSEGEGVGRNIAFLPGARDSEFSNHCLPMAEAFKRSRQKHADLRALLSVPKAVDSTWRREAVKAFSPDAEATDFDGTLLTAPHAETLTETLNACEARGFSHASLLPRASAFSVVKSGTSTLEAGLQGQPMCVVYRGGRISFAIAKLLVDIPVFSLVNIVLGKYVVPELLQSEVSGDGIAAEIERGLTDEGYIERQRAALAELPGKLGGPGASKRAARAMLDFLRGRE